MTRQGLYKVLRSLRERGYVEEGPVVKLSQKGRDVLSAALKDLLSYFNIVSIKLSGVVISGLGEGAFYISLEGYRRAIERLLGFTPYPGTFNVKLDPQSVPYRRYLDSLPGILIAGFSNGVRTYGAVKAFRARIRGIESAVVMPERTHHPSDVIEVVAPVKLRDVLGLRDGDRVEIEIYL
jgi:CTP-dependent riboflavin kinase (EC 2.7.1.-)